MRIVTWNFLSGGSKVRAAHWELIRARLAPEILLAQECRPPDALGGGWNDALWFRAPGRGWGTGVYLLRGTIRHMPVPGFRGRVTGGELQRRITRRPLRVFSVHCPPGEHGYVRTLGRILDRLRPMARDADLVLGGDFNVVVGLRGADERIRMSAGERMTLERLAMEFELLPCWQTMNPGAPLAQTLRWTGDRTAPYHCDGIFVPARWRRRMESCQVIRGPEWDRLSDHNPVAAVVARARLTPQALCAPSPGR